MTSSNPFKLRGGIAFVATCLLALSACGGSSESTDTTVAATTDTVAAGESAADIAAARVAKYLQTNSTLNIGDAPSAAPEGKTVYYMTCSVAVCAEIQVGVEAAAKALGWTFKSTSHQDTPETVAAAFDAAIAAKPDVIFESGVPREWFATQLATLQEMKIPVIAW